MRPVLFVIALLTSAAPAVDAKCARTTFHPAVLSPAAIPTGTGVLVHTDRDFEDTDDGEAFQPTWVWKDGAGATTKPTVTTLAPGLVVYQLPANATAAELTDGKVARATVTAAAASKTTLGAPTVARVTHSVTRQGRGNGLQVRVELSANTPKGAVAMIIYNAKSKQALSYALVDGPDLTSVDVYVRGRCSADPTGTVAPTAKQKVFVRYVDAFGRLSPASKTASVVSTKAPAYDE